MDLMRDPFAADPLRVRVLAEIRDNLLAVIVALGYLVWFALCAAAFLAAVFVFVWLYLTIF